MVKSKYGGKSTGKKNLLSSCGRRSVFPRRRAYRRDLLPGAPCVGRGDVAGSSLHYLGEKKIDRGISGVSCEGSHAPVKKGDEVVNF